MLTNPEAWFPQDHGGIAKASGLGQWHVPTIGGWRAGPQTRPGPSIYAPAFVDDSG